MHIRCEIKMIKLIKRAILFVDFPQLVNGTVKYDFYELFNNLWNEFDEIRTFTKIPREPRDEKDVWGVIRVATMAGGLPTLYPSDVDGIITVDILRTLEREDVKKIAILSGDNGYNPVLRMTKRVGKKIKVILPSNSNSYLLRSVADELATIDEYATEYIPGTSQNSNPVDLIGCSS